MKTKIKTLLLVILCLPFISQAQVSQNLSKQFPAHIVYKIADLVSKINLTEDKQIKIGKKLVTADSLATISLMNGKPSSELKSFYTVDTNFLKPILSQKELDDYGYEMDKDNRYLVALKFAPELKLEPTQISQIHQRNNALANVLGIISSKEKIEQYNTNLSQILSENQYVILLKIIYKEQSMDDAQKDWKKIKQLQLVANDNDKTIFSEILSYHLGKNAFLDQKANQNNKNESDFRNNKMALTEPLLLVHINILSDDTYLSNKYASVIRDEKELKLTKSQTDTLLLKYRQFESIRFQNKERELAHTAPSPIPSEYDAIAKILSPDQVTKWLLNKNVKEAKRLGFRNWEQLEVEGLATGLNKDKTLTELSVYHLKYLVTKEHLMIDHIQEIDLYMRKVEQEKPELLKQLDIKIAQGRTKNVLTW